MGEHFFSNADKHFCSIACLLSNTSICAGMITERRSVNVQTERQTHSYGFVMQVLLVIMQL